MKNKIFSLLLSISMLFAMTVPAMATDNIVESRKTVNYLCLGDSIPAGVGSELWDDLAYSGDADKTETLIEKTINGEFFVEEAYSNLLKMYFASEGNGVGEYTKNYSQCGARLRELNTALGLVNADSYTTDFYNVVMGSYATTTSQFDVDGINESLANADVITFNYGSNEIMSNLIYHVLDDTGMLEDIKSGKEISLEELLDIESLIKSLGGAAKTLIMMDSYTNRSIADFKTNWNTFYDYLRNDINNKDAKLVFVGLYNPSEALLGSEFKKEDFDGYIKQINDFMKEKAAEDDNLVFVDISKIGTDKMLAGDNMHPSIEGHKYVANQIEQALTGDDCLHLKMGRVGAKATSIYSKGYTGDFGCLDCGKVFDKVGKDIPMIKSSVKVSTLPCKVKQSFKASSNMIVAKGDAVARVTSSNKKVAKVSGTTIKGVKKGKATITVKMKSGQTYSFKVKVQKGAVKCSKLTTIIGSKLTLAKGKKASIGASKSPCTCKYKVTYKSSKKKVATVSKSGVITAKKKGTAKITVACKGKKKTIKVTVK